MNQVADTGACQLRICSVLVEHTHVGTLKQEKVSKAMHGFFPLFQAEVKCVCTSLVLMKINSQLRATSPRVTQLNDTVFLAGVKASVSHWV